MADDLLIQNWTNTRDQIASAAVRYGRSADSIQLLAISKGQPANKLRQIAEAGQRQFGENYVQEALGKITQLTDLQLTWHFTGQIQGNKTRSIAEHFAWVHTVDRERIALRLNEQRPLALEPLNMCIQVSLEDEPGKGGIEPSQLLSLATRIAEMPRLRLRGLMCIPPPRDTFDEQRLLFQRMKDQFDALKREGFELDTLSMGMTGDLDAAIAAGATLVRIGTAIFGARV
jgi:PLP dependent protein